MATQIAIRIPDEELRALDDAVEAGEFGSRAEGMRAALRGLLRERREREVARQYREAYAGQPAEEAVGEAGAELLAEAIARDESTQG